jgi:hypothetical protein
MLNSNKTTGWGRVGGAVFMNYKTIGPRSGTKRQYLFGLEVLRGSNMVGVRGKGKGVRGVKSGFVARGENEKIAVSH